MSFIKSFFKGFLIVLFLPFYWLYTIIWFIFFRGKLKDYPRVKKDETAKHLILMIISLFVFFIFGNTFIKETTTQKETETLVTNDKRIESAEFLEIQNNENAYTSLDANNLIEDITENGSIENTDISDIDLNSSKSISPYYHAPIKDDESYSVSTYYENSDYRGYEEFSNDYEQTVDKDYDYESNDEENKTSADNETIPDNSYLENDTLVWVDDTAAKYHSSSDTPKHPNAKMDAPRQVTLTEALNMGKKPCGICYR